jgi:glutamate synthase domain-containing protein 2
MFRTATNAISASSHIVPLPPRIWAETTIWLNGSRSMLNIAGKVQKSGKQVTSEDVARARAKGATDKEIHDTVLIAAAFCMYNRYVDGLATPQPLGREAYHEMGERMAHQGYGRAR